MILSQQQALTIYKLVEPETFEQLKLLMGYIEANLHAAIPDAKDEYLVKLSGMLAITRSIKQLDVTVEQARKHKW